MKIPWEKAVKHLKAEATEQAVIQHLMKARKARLQLGQPVPPEATKRRKKEPKGRNHAKAVDDEDDDDDEDGCAAPFKGSKNRLVWDPIEKTKKSSSSSSGTDIYDVITVCVKEEPATEEKPMGVGQGRDRHLEPMLQSSSILDTSASAGMVDSEDDHAPSSHDVVPSKRKRQSNTNVTQPKKKRGRPFGAVAGPEQTSSVSQVGVPSQDLLFPPRRRATQNINYQESVHEEDLEGQVKFGASALEHDQDAYSEDESGEDQHEGT